MELSSQKQKTNSALIQNFLRTSNQQMCFARACRTYDDRRTRGFYVIDIRLKKAGQAINPSMEFDQTLSNLRNVNTNSNIGFAFI